MAVQGQKSNEKCGTIFKLFLRGAGYSPAVFIRGYERHTFPSGWAVYQEREPAKHAGRGGTSSGGNYDLAIATHTFLVGHLPTVRPARTQRRSRLLRAPVVLTLLPGTL